MYLTDLAFIEEGTPNYTEDGLVNFSKMRMVSAPAHCCGHRGQAGLMWLWPRLCPLSLHLLSTRRPHVSPAHTWACS